MAAKSIKKLAAITAAFSIAFVSPIQAAIRPINAFEQIEIIDQESKALNLSVFQKAHMIAMEHRFKMENFIPYADIKATDSTKTVTGRIAEHTLEYLLEAAQYDGTAPTFIRSAARINNAVDTKIETADGSKIAFRVKPLETRAEVAYSGVVNATLSYEIADASLKFEVSKDIRGKSLTLTHTNDNSESRDVVGMRWTF